MSINIQIPIDIKITTQFPFKKNDLNNKTLKNIAHHVCNTFGKFIEKCDEIDAICDFASDVTGFCVNISHFQFKMTDEPHIDDSSVRVSVLWDLDFEFDLTGDSDEDVADEGDIDNIKLQNEFTNYWKNLSKDSEDSLYKEIKTNFEQITGLVVQKIDISTISVLELKPVSHI